MTEQQRMSRHVMIGVGILLVIVVLAVGAAIRAGIGPFAPAQQCIAGTGDAKVELDFDQAENAAVISAVAISRGLPRRAITVALATAYQESKIQNLTYGDRDSLGLFQQRPSQGWGTRTQILDPWYSAGKFYEALEKVKNWESLDVTVAAQKVQRSAYPSAYAKHEGNAVTLSGAFSGEVPRSLYCVYRPDSGTHGTSAAVNSLLRKGFGSATVANSGSTATGTPVQVSASSDKRNAQIATFLAAHCSKLKLSLLTQSSYSWHSGGSSKHGWTSGTIAGIDHIPGHNLFYKVA